MNRDWRDKLAAYDDPQLDDRERRELDALLDSEPEARDFLAALRADEAAFRDAFSQVKARDGFTAAVMARLPERRTGWLGRCPLPRTLELCAAALMLLVIGSGVNVRRTVEQARQIACQSGVKDVSRMVLAYAQDYDGRFPDAGNWAVQVSQHQPGWQAPVCPSDDLPTTVSYGMPLSLSGAPLARVQTPDREVLVFDAEGSFLAPRHQGGANVSFVDGQVRLVDQQSELSWAPWSRR